MKFNQINMAVNFTLPIRRERFEGREHIVAPVVALVEGVHNDLFYPASELAKFPDSWNGVSLPIFHPEDEGKNNSANTPKLIEERSDGRLNNVHFETEKARLVGEICVDIEKARQLSPAALEAIEAGRQLEVSTALFTDGDGTSGNWNGEEYVETVINFRPDHLALLPGGKGACSWEDGCGVRANEKSDEKNGVMEKMRSFFKTMASQFGLTVQETSHEQLRSQIQAALDGLDNAGWIHFVRDVYNDNFIYEARGDNPSEIGGPGAISKLYQRGYSADENGQVTLADNAQEVVEKTEYVPVANANKDNKNISSKEDDAMKQDELIKSLIECTHNTLTEDHKEWLKGLSDDQLKALTFVEEEKPEVNADKDKPVVDKKKPEANDKDADPKPNADDKAEPATVDEYIANAPAEVQSVLKRSVARDRIVKADLVKGLMANKRNKFTEEQLKAKDIDELEVLAELGQVDVDYTLSRGTASVEANDDDSPPAPIPVFKMEKKDPEPEKKTA
jgi:hypothetical protein